MPSFRSARIASIDHARRGYQRVTLDDGDRAYVLTQLIGPVSVGDRVIVNTTAVDLGLGTGGAHVVHWNLERDAWSEPGPGHIMKLRYTSLQADTGAAEEALGADLPVDLGGLPVVACGLHSQMAAAAVAFRDAAPKARLAYVMTDGGALPLALSDMVEQLGEGVVDFTVTAGQAFGGDLEAVNLHSGLLVARAAGADAILAGIGPGVVGTGTATGHTGLDVAEVVNATAALGGTPLVAARVSDADPRERHRGRSHHTVQALRLALASAEVPDPDAIPIPDIAALLQARGIRVTTMGRGPEEDPSFFRWAAAAGVAAARLAQGSGS